VFTETFTARYDRGRGIPVFPPLPYFPEAAAAALADTTTLVTVGTREPVANFAFPGVPGRLTPDWTTRFDFATDDPQPVLEAIADRLDAPEVPVPDASLTDPAPGDTITARSLGALVAAHLAEGTVLVDEGATNSYGYTRSAAAAAPHVALGLTGGSIGIGLPLAVGAAVATGGPVVALQADGSAMYTNQSLWTMAREGLDVTVVILANERYAILQTEMHRAGSDELGPVSRSLTELREPVIDFVALAASMGVRGTRCRTNGDAAHALAAASAEPGPHLLQVDLEPAGASA
jgi:acetolactate synthase-1/2/3 large subunit